MLPRPHRAIANFAVVVIVVSMLLSTIPPELGAKFDQRYTTTDDTFTLYFDETFEYESVHSAFSQPQVLLSIGEMNAATGTISGTISRSIARIARSISRTVTRITASTLEKKNLFTLKSPNWRL